MIRHGFTDRLFHRFALHSRAFRRFGFERECERNGFRFDPGRENLFIAGAARAGSTALLNTLYASDAFASTCYRHMPFVMTPSLSRLVAAIRREKAAPSERRHGDAVRVDLDSPEALDGVFWSTYLERDGDRIQPRDPGEKLLQGYAMFIENLLLFEARDRYLSKMNQHIDLLAGLAGYFERSLFLLPFRDPLHQAASLLRQHRNFEKLSSYETGYLGWLGHHEFGATHIGFYEASAQPSSGYPIESLDYWLEQWRNAYAYLARLVDDHANLVPLGYESLAASDAPWRALSRRLGIDVRGDGYLNRNLAENEAAARFDSALMDDCRALYAQLSAQQEARLC